MEWIINQNPEPYPQAIQTMEKRVEDILAGKAEEAVWLLEHPSLYTAGTSANDCDLIDPRFPVFKTGRGGEYTYHGPGQRVGYILLNLKERGVPDLRRYVRFLEEWLILTLKSFTVRAERRPGRVGLWVPMGGYGGAAEEEAKIAAIGVRVRRWVTFHGFSLNVQPQLSHFSGIVPCGIKEHGVTSLADLGIKADMKAVDRALRQSFEPAWQIIYR